MRHVRLISARPQRAQTNGLCEELDSDFQARLCFALQFFTGFLLPVLELKNSGEDNTTGLSEA